MERFPWGGRPVYVGARLPRVEDERLVAARGTYVADIRFPGMVEATVVRSFVPHARLVEVRLAGARASGVLAAVAAADLAGVAPFPDFVEHARPVGTFPLCRDRIRYVGAPVAAIVATDRYAAEDAAELVEVDYEELPVVASIQAALAPDASRLFDDWEDNRIVHSSRHDPVVDDLFRRHRVISATYSMHRQAPVPLETRGAVADYRDGRLTLWTGNQSPHIVRTTLHYTLGLPERAIRVVVPDVGGSFGCKTHVYPEEVLVSWLATRLRRPVRWIEDRAEHMVASIHAREQVHEMKAAVADDGTILALRCHITTDVGSGEIFMPGFDTGFVSASLFTGPYRIPHGDLAVTAVVTNKTPSGAYRGFGAPEMVFALERLIDTVARETGSDPALLRARMLLRPSDLPHVLQSGARIDSGSHLEAYERASGLTDLAEARARSSFAWDHNVRIGAAVVPFVEGTAPTYFGTTGHWAGHDACVLRVEPDGSVIVRVGLTSTGQGVETMVATLAADALGVPLENVRVEMGDTDLSPYGLGGWGSRSTVIGGGAILAAASRVREKILRIAGHLLEVDAADLVIEGGEVRVRGSDRPRIALANVATVATIRILNLPPGEEPGLEASAVYEPPTLQHVPDEKGRMNGSSTYVNAAHGAVVSVDVESGRVEVLDYVVVHDCGRVINPVIVEGQIHGGVAQGIAGALYEHAGYSSEGLPAAITFMDYVLPSAVEVPAIVVEHMESPAPEMPLGVKGSGEAGAVGGAAVIGNAIEHALHEFGIEITSTPFTPASIRGMIREARKVELKEEATPSR